MATFNNQCGSTIRRWWHTRARHHKCAAHRASVWCANPIPVSCFDLNGPLHVCAEARRPVSIHGARQCEEEDEDVRCMRREDLEETSSTGASRSAQGQDRSQKTQLNIERARERAEEHRTRCWFGCGRKSRGPEQDHSETKGGWRKYTGLGAFCGRTAGAF